MFAECKHQIKQKTKIENVAFQKHFCAKSLQFLLLITIIGNLLTWHTKLLLYAPAVHYGCEA